MKPAYALSWLEFKNIIEVSRKDNVDLTKYAFIEIMGQQDLLTHHWILKGPAHPFDMEASDNILQLCFDDVDEPLAIPILGELEDEREYNHVLPMNEHQAIIIINFVKLHQDKRSFLVHCAAGVSRSGAVAQFIMEYFGGTHEEYKRLNPYTVPNQRILNILRKLAGLNPTDYD